MAAFLELTHRQKRGNFFAGLKIEQIDDRFSPRSAARLGQLMDFDPIHFTDGGEKQNIGMHRRDEEIFDKVFLFGRCADLAFAAAPLCPVQADGISFDVAIVGDRHRHVFIDDHVLDGDIFGPVDNLRAPLIAVFFLDLPQFLDDDFVNFFFVGENRAQFSDQFKRLAVLVHDLAALQAGQALQAQVQDRLRLDLAQTEIAHQAFFGDFRIGRATDERNHGVQIVERNAIAF